MSYLEHLTDKADDDDDDDDDDRPMMIKNYCQSMVGWSVTCVLLVIQT